jgi:hypothetical protein
MPNGTASEPLAPAAPGSPVALEEPGVPDDEHAAAPSATSASTKHVDRCTALHGLCRTAGAFVLSTQLLLVSQPDSMHPGAIDP